MVLLECRNLHFDISQKSKKRGIFPPQNSKIFAKRIIWQKNAIFEGFFYLAVNQMDAAIFGLFLIVAMKAVKKSIDRFFQKGHPFEKKAHLFEQAKVGFGCQENQKKCQNLHISREVCSFQRLIIVKNLEKVLHFVPVPF